MTIPDFLAALPQVKARYHWHTDELGAVRGTAHGMVYTPLTALCEVRTGVYYEPMLDWDRAGLALGLAIEDASEVVSDEDADACHDPVLAQAIRAVLGVRSRDEDEAS